MIPVPEREVEVILVDEHDADIGRCPKLEAHRRALLHRAVSVFAFNTSGQLLIQQRAAGKYHSGGLWSNTACTHPREGETLERAVTRGMLEELAVPPGSLTYAFPFLYRAEVGGGLVEHEYDHVFVGTLDADPVPVPGEVSACAWREPHALAAEMNEHPAGFTAWFRLLLPSVLSWRGGEGRA